MSNPILTANGTTLIPLLSGRVYTLAAGGTFGGGTINAELLLDDGTPVPLEGFPITTPANLHIPATTASLRLTLSGATAPSITYAVNLTQGGTLEAIGAESPAGAQAKADAAQAAAALDATAKADAAVIAALTANHANAEMRDYIIEECIRGNIFNAPGGGRYASPGPLYASGGQWIADGCYSALGLAEIGDFEDAWDVLKFFALSQNTITGLIPRNTRPDGSFSGQNNLTSQWPIIAWTAWQVYQRDPDAVNLEIVYEIAKKHLTFWETKRQDASGLAFWGCEDAVITESDVRYFASAEGALDRYGFANDNTLTVGSNLSGVGKGMEHCDPILNALLVMEADHLALIAEELSESGEQATYEAKAAARRALMNSIMWDEEQGWYQRPVRLDKAIGRNLVGSISGKTLVIDSTGVNSYSIIPAGEVLVFSNGATAQAAPNPARPDGNWEIGPAVAADGLRTVTLVTAPVGVTVGTAIISRPFAYFKCMPDVALCLHAKIPPVASGRAARLVNNLYRHMDGTQPDTYKLSFHDKAYRGVASAKQGWTRWYVANFALPAPTGTNSFFNTASPGISYRYRHPGVALFSYEASVPKLRDFIFDNKDDERPSRFRPVSAKVHYQKNGTGGLPTLSAKNYTTVVGNAVSLTPQVAPTYVGADNIALVSGALEYQGPEVLGEVTLGKTGSSFYCFGLEITTYPVGWLFNSPYGFTTTNRFDGHCFFKPGDEPQTIEQDDTYWQPGIWAHFQYHLYEGLLNYNEPIKAAAHAEKFVDSWGGAFAATGDIAEYLTPRGYPRGSVKYAWSGVALLLVMRKAGIFKHATP